MMLLSKPSIEPILAKTSGVKYSDAREIKLVLIVASTRARLSDLNIIKLGAGQPLLFSAPKRLRFNVWLRAWFLESYKPAAINPQAATNKSLRIVVLVFIIEFILFPVMVLMKNQLLHPR